jgi:hypothetical protein
MACIADQSSGRGEGKDGGGNGEANGREQRQKIHQMIAEKTIVHKWGGNRDERKGGERR